MVNLTNTKRSFLLLLKCPHVYLPLCHMIRCIQQGFTPYLQTLGIHINRQVLDIKQVIMLLLYKSNSFLPFSFRTIFSSLIFINNLIRYMLTTDNLQYSYAIIY